MQCYAYRACLCHPSACYASLHACLHVHAWVLLANVSSMLQHNEVMDIWSKPTFVPRRHHPLFVFLLVCLRACFKKKKKSSKNKKSFELHDDLIPLKLLSCFFACHVYHAYPLYVSFICTLHLFLPLLVYWFLVFAFACTHMERGRMKLGHGLPVASKKGKDASM